jgi:hypothetical protein
MVCNIVHALSRSKILFGRPKDFPCLRALLRCHRCRQHIDARLRAKRIAPEGCGSGGWNGDNPARGDEDGRRSKNYPLEQDGNVGLCSTPTTCCHTGATEPDDYLFPTFLFRRKQKSGSEKSGYDPKKPQVSWRTGWRNLTKRAGLQGLRFHDLRHHCITKLAEAGVADQTLMSIAGHVSKAMLDHYRHIRSMREERL